jgi:hypothetical protein
VAIWASKLLQGLHIDVGLLSETHLKPNERFFIHNYHFYQTGRFSGRKGIPLNHADLCYTCDTDTWRKARQIHKRQTNSLVRKEVTWGLFPEGFSWKYSLLVSLKGLGAKTNWLAVNRQSYSNSGSDSDSNLRSLLRFSRCELLLLEAGSWCRGPFGILEEGERPPLVAVTKQRQWRRDCVH